MKIAAWIASFTLLFSCGYHFEGSNPEGGETTISLPYIPGDAQGELNDALVQALSETGVFDCIQKGGALLLEVSIIEDGDTRIGFRYDRDPTSGELRTNIVGTENRRAMSAKVTITDTYTGKVLIGPEVISANADYDYVDSNSIRDLTFTNTQGTPQTVLNFSLGQLDSFEGAHDDSAIVIYKALAKKIVNGLLLKLNQESEV